MLVGGLVAFVALALAYEHEPLRTVDTEVLVWTTTDMPDWLAWAARPFSWVGGWIGLTVLGVTGAVLLVRERAWLDLAFLLSAVLGTQAIVSALKAFFDRARPQLEAVVEVPASPSFPSGHAAAGAATFAAMAILLAERLPRRMRAEFWLAVAALGALIGLSRIALHVHYVTDVLAGWCLGIAWLALCLLARERFRASG